MSDPHDSHSSSAPAEDEPETPFWLPALGFALFVFGGLGWAVSPSATQGTPGPLPPPPVVNVAPAAPSASAAPAPPPQAAPPPPVPSAAPAASASGAKGKKLPPPPGARPKKAKPIAPANP
jgi:hypothetical protein